MYHRKTLADGLNHYYRLIGTLKRNFWIITRENGGIEMHSTNHE